MSHGQYAIKVVRVSDGTEMFTYTGAVHPANGETLITKDGVSLVVVNAQHVLSGGRDGNGPYYWLDHVLLVVAK